MENRNDNEWTATKIAILEPAWNANVDQARTRLEVRLHARKHSAMR